MHFVVANVVMPLTQSKTASFVTLWGGRRVDYFVSLGRLEKDVFSDLTRAKISGNIDQNWVLTI